MCAETSLVISNIVTSPLPPKMAFSFSSARMLRLLVGFWRLFFLMYTQSCLTTSVLGSGPFPTTASSSAERLRGFDRAEFIAIMDVILLILRDRFSIPLYRYCNIDVVVYWGI